MTGDTEVSDRLRAQDPLLQRQLELMRVLVKAALPLEVIRASGWDRHFTRGLRDAITEAIHEVREALKG